VLREREPAMKALAKRVGTRSTGIATQEVSARPIAERGPRNQPKRKHRR